MDITPKIGSIDTESAHRIMATFRPLLGEPKVKELLADESKLKEAIMSTNEHIKNCALVIYCSARILNQELVPHLVDLAQNDTSVLVRCNAILSLSVICIHTGDADLIRLFAQIALNEQESETVRKAAYQSAILSCNCHYPNEHIHKFNMHNSGLCDFRLDFLNYIEHELGDGKQGRS